jgi:hypothetical protein
LVKVLDGVDDIDDDDEVLLEVNEDVRWLMLDHEAACNDVVDLDVAVFL